jgi:hypothetical protein
MKRVKHHVQRNRHHSKAFNELLILVLAAWIAEGTMDLARHELSAYHMEARA